MSTQTQRPPWNDAPHYSNINWSHLDQEDIMCEDVHVSWNVGDELYKGLEFQSKELLKNALMQYHIKIHQTYSIVESKVKKYIMNCKNMHDGCPFYMRAILLKEESETITIESHYLI